MTTLVPSVLDESCFNDNHERLNEFEFCHCFKLQLSAIEHHKLWSFQTLCWLPGEQ